MRYDKHYGVLNDCNRLILGIFLLLPLSANAKADNIIWRAGYNYVALSSADSKHVENDHPVSFSPRDVYEILGSIRLAAADKRFLDLDFFLDDEEADETMLFSRSELQRISRPIAEAMAAAKPDEDVIFTISDSHQKFIGKGTLSTAGRLFYSGGRLNLILGNLRVDIEQAYRKRGGYSDVAEKIDYNKLSKFRLASGSRRSASDIAETFATNDILSLKANGENLRRDWLLIDVSAFKQQLTARRQHKEREDSLVEAAADIKQQTQKIDEEQQKLKQKIEQMERHLEANEQQTAQKIAPKATVQKLRTIEERLTELKSLKDKGFITEEIYQQKAKEILQDL